MARSPLFDIYDPQGILQQQAAMGLLPEDDEELDVFGAFPVKRKPQLSDLMPEEEQQGLLQMLELSLKPQILKSKDSAGRATTKAVKALML